MSQIELILGICRYTAQSGILYLLYCAQTKAIFDQLQRLLPKSKLLRPAPFSTPFPGQQEANAMRSYVDDLRWLIQCSDVEIRTPRISGGVPKQEQLAEEALLASVDGSASNSGLDMKLYSAQGQRCQRSAGLT